jgi:hypothetical protein
MTEAHRKMDNAVLTTMTVRQLKEFAKAISEHDLWDEVEAHLHAEGCHALHLSFEPVRAIGALLKRKKASAEIVAKQHPIPECGCNGTYHPPNTPSGPNTPPSSGAGGPPDGGAPPGDGGPKPQ